MQGTPAIGWLLRAAWLTLPVTAGGALAEGLERRSASVAGVLAAMAWAGWAAGLLALLAPRPTGLALVRVLAPAGVLLAALAGEPRWAAGVPAVVAVLALLPDVGRWLVNGSSYGDERRHLLRPPGAVLVGPLPLAWAALVAAASTGPLLLAARQWVVGGIAVALGVPVAVVTWRALAALTERWLVFVPAGVVVKDHISLRDPYLFRRQDVAALRPAEAGSAATDLTGGAFGLALELRLGQVAQPVLARTGAQTPVAAMLLTPSRPGAVLADAAARRYRTA